MSETRDRGKDPWRSGLEDQTVTGLPVSECNSARMNVKSATPRTWVFPFILVFCLWLLNKNKASKSNNLMGLHGLLQGWLSIFVVKIQWRHILKTSWNRTNKYLSKEKYYRDVYKYKENLWLKFHMKEKIRTVLGSNVKTNLTHL
jgi:hypothetical protein